MPWRDRRWMRRWCGWALAAALAAAASARAVPPARTLVVGMEDYPPFEFIANGAPTGINVEVTARIAQRQGYAVEFQTLPFPRIWMLLGHGKVDAALSVSYQPKRESQLLFTDDQRAFANTGTPPSNYLWMTEYVFFANQNYAAALRFESYDQVRESGYRVGTLREYSYDAAFWNAGLKTTEFVLPEDGFRALEAGTIDLFPMDRTVGLWLVRRMGLQNRITNLPKPLFAKPYLTVFARASRFPDIEGVMRNFYAELQRMRQSGEYAAIAARYQPQAPAPASRPLVFVCEEWAPYEYLEGSTVTGIDVEVTRRIMERLRIPFEIQFYPWSRAWMLVEKGKADAVLSVSYKASRTNMLYYTPEQIAFAQTGTPPPDYLWNAEYVFFIMAKNSQRLRFDSYAQIKTDNLRVGVNRDYSYDPAFMDAGLRSAIYPDTEAGFMALVKDEIDLYPMDRTVGLAMLTRLGLRESITFLPKPLFTKPYLAPFSRCSDYPGLEGLMQAYYRELRTLRDSGEYQRIYNRFVAPGAATTAAEDGQ